MDSNMAGNSATIISVIALVFSFGTTFVSYRRTRAQDIQSLRQELRGILQRLTAIPREVLDANKRYMADQAAVAGVSRIYNQENSLLVRQAAEIVTKLPKNMVSATEYSEIALAQQNSYNLAEAKAFLKLAIESATNFNDEIGPVRMTANLSFITGEPQAGRIKYQEALNIFAKYPGYDMFTKVSTHVNTEIMWGQSEAGIGEFASALQHLDNAQKLVETLPFSPGAQSLMSQIAEPRALFERSRTSNIMGTVMPLSSTPLK